ncbi:MAG TPA: ABC transporter permease [Phototrophicaceae bacterium]|nr:ABC transporter permease [Phototrophicaceae bacterium]
MIAAVLDNIRLSVGELLTNKLRAFLTVLGITIGIAAVVLLLSLGQSVQAYVTDQFETLGANTIRISAQPDSSRRLVPITEELADRIKNSGEIPDVTILMPEATGNFSVIYENNQFNESVDGVTTDFLALEGRTVDSGRFFTQDEYNQSAQVAIIGQTTATNLFGDPSKALGQQIRIKNVIFQVIGLFNKSGTQDDLVVIPLSAYKARLNDTLSTTGETVVNTIEAAAADLSTVTAATNELTTVLRQQRGIQDQSGNSDNFRIFTASTILDSITSIISIFTVFLGAVAGISLLVGGINVMNIMLVTITERTREIGLRKATGAQDSDIVVLFLTQAVVLTLIGGGIGVAIAVAAAKIITSLVSGFTVLVQPGNVIFAVTISAAIGIFFGVYPASRAAKLNPIEALRYE